ncbi:MAG TPA: ABC transporter substrate-binding protein [Kiritimatiellia bacterium]|nr:ABC transporter substrate-binding protein [Kiritimatiellia bacterium]
MSCCFKRRPRGIIPRRGGGCIHTGWLLVLAFHLLVPSASVSARGLEPVKLQLKYRHGFQFAGYYAAKIKGFYEAEGLDVTILEAVRGVYPVDAVLSGEAEYGVMAEELLVERAHGKPLVVMGAIYQHSPYILLALRESGIRTVEHLAGRRVMRSFNRPSPQMDAMLKNADVLPDSVHFVPHDWNIESLISGRADAMDAYLTDEPNLVRLRGLEPVILSPMDYGIDFYGDCFFTTEDEIRLHHRRARGFHCATLRGWAYALEHQEELIDFILTLPGVEERGITREHLQYEAEQSVKLIRPDLIKLGEINPNRWERMAKTYVALGLIPSGFSLEGFIYDPGHEPHWHWLHILLIVLASLLIAAAIFWSWNRQLRRSVAAAIRDRRETDRRAYKLFHEVAQGVVIADTDNGKITYANPAIGRLLGYSKPELLKMESQDLHPAKEWDRVRNAFTAQTEGDHLVASEIPYLRKDGTLMYADVTVSKTRIGGRARNVAFITDITERLEAKRSLQRSLAVSNRIRKFMVDISGCRTVEGLLEPLLQAAMDICGMDCGGVYIVENDAACLKHTVNLDDELKSLVARMPLANPLMKSAAEAREPVYAHDVSEDMRSMLLSFGIQHAYSIPFFEDGHLFGFLNVGTHCEEPPDSVAIHNLSVLALEAQSVIRRIADEAVRNRMMMAIEQAAESIVISGPDHLIVYANPAFEKLTGYTLEEVLGVHPHILDAGQHEPGYLEEVEAMVTRGETWRGQFINKTKDGRIIIEEACVTPVFDPAGAIVNYVTVKRDITRELKLEEQLRHAQKMEAVGKLAGGIAHDFNNLLQTILGYAELIMKSPNADADTRADMEEVYSAAERAAGLTRQLLTFSRRQVIRPQSVDVNELLTSLVKILRRGIRADIALEVDPGTDLWPVFADPGQMEQVLINLCFNARDAMPEGGRLLIEARNEEISQEFFRQNPWAREGRYVRLRVTDTGSGIAPETMERMYEPFFTTKEAGKGTGLGLSTVYGVIEQHNGLIHVESQVGRGSVFDVYFPVARKEPDRPAEPASSPSGNGRETILLAEDDPSVVGYTRRVLERAGYTVLTASTGVEAVELFSRSTGRVNLVLMDVVMPGLTGVAARDEMLKIRPDIPILFISGYSHGAIRAERIAKEKIEIIQKPFRASDLLARIREILDRRPA